MFHIMMLQKKMTLNKLLHNSVLRFHVSCAHFYIETNIKNFVKFHV